MSSAPSMASACRASLTFPQLRTGPPSGTSLSASSTCCMSSLVLRRASHHPPRPPRPHPSTLHCPCPRAPYPLRPDPCHPGVPACIGRLGLHGCWGALRGPAVPSRFYSLPSPCCSALTNCGHFQLYWFVLPFPFAYSRSASYPIVVPSPLLSARHPVRMRPFPACKAGPL